MLGSDNSYNLKFRLIIDQYSSHKLISSTGSRTENKSEIGTLCSPLFQKEMKKLLEEVTYDQIKSCTGNSDGLILTL